MHSFVVSTYCAALWMNATKYLIGNPASVGKGHFSDQFTRENYENDCHRLELWKVTCYSRGTDVGLLQAILVQTLQASYPPSE